MATGTNHCSMSVTGAAAQELQSTYGVFAGVIVGIGGRNESALSGTPARCTVALCSRVAHALNR